MTTKLHISHHSGVDEGRRKTAGFGPYGAMWFALLASFYFGQGPFVFAALTYQTLTGQIQAPPLQGDRPFDQLIYEQELQTHRTDLAIGWTGGAVALLAFIIAIVLAIRVVKRDARNWQGWIALVLAGLMFALAAVNLSTPLSHLGGL